MEKRRSRLIVKIILLGVLLALLAYVFHPGSGHLSVMINGQPVADPLARIAAGPLFLGILLLTGILAALVILGVGTFMVIVLALLAVAGVAMAAPYFWPVLVIVILVVSLASLASREEK
jgi:hypothetical protein